MKEKIASKKDFLDEYQNCYKIKNFQHGRRTKIINEIDIKKISTNDLKRAVYLDIVDYKKSVGDFMSRTGDHLYNYQQIDNVNKFYNKYY